MNKFLNTKQHKLNLEVVLFLALYTILPSYFAVEFSKSLPLITGSRMLLILMGIMLVLHRRHDLFSLQRFQISKLNLFLARDKFLRNGLLIYFGLLLLVNATFLTTTSEAIKQIFVIVAEEYAIVWMLSLILDTREKLICAVRTMVFASGIVGLIAIFSVITQFNPFHLLNTVSRSMMQATYYRMGLLRAAAGFGHPVYYGAYCAVMTPLCMYFIETSTDKRQRFLFRGCMVLNMVCVLLSNSRGSILALLFTAGLMLVISLFNGRLKQFMITYAPLLVIALVILLLVAVLAIVGAPLLGDLIDSILSSISTPPTSVPGDSADPTVPSDPSFDFGENPHGLSSRMVQLTAIPYVLSKNALFGLGPNAFAHGLVAYTYVAGHLSFIKTVDMNIVAIIGQYGLIGLLGFLAQFGSVGITLVRKKYRQDTLMQFLLMSFICYMLCLLSISNLDKWYWLVVGFIVCLTNIMHKEVTQHPKEENL